MILLPNSPFSSVSNYQAMISTSLKKKYINFIHNAVADTEEQLHKQIFFSFSREHELVKSAKHV